MSYPNVHFGNEGEQYNTYSTERWPVGTRMMLQDGRTFQFAEAGAVALAAGVLCQSEVPDADHDTLAVAAAGAVGDKFVTITNGVDTIEAGARHEPDEQFGRGRFNLFSQARRDSGRGSGRGALPEVQRSS